MKDERIEHAEKVALFRYGLISHLLQPAPDNDDTLTAEDLALGYKQLLRVEQCWRQLKSGLRMRPVFHYRPSRIQAHVTISVLALLLERIVEIRAGDTWRNVCAELERVKVVEYERGEARVVQTTEVTPPIATLLRKLRVAPPPKLHAVERMLLARNCLKSLLRLVTRLFPRIPSYLSILIGKSVPMGHQRFSKSGFVPTPSTS
jgi:hypothetical protein